MIWLTLIAVIILVIVHNKSKKKKSASSAPTAPTATSTPAKPVSKSASKVSPAEEAALSGVDRDAFAKAFAHMSGDGSDTPKKTGGNDAADRKWVREHPFTDRLCRFYTHSWGPGGGIYEKVASGDLPIIRLVLRVDADKIHETLYMKDGSNFESDSTFESFEAKDGYTRLDTAAKRDELHRCLVQRLGELSTIEVKSDGLHIITGAAAPVKPAQPPKPAPAKDPADELFGIDHDAVARAMARMNGDAEPIEPPKPEPKPAPAPDDTERFKAFLAKILGYYHSMWNKEDGSLYTELDTTMPIDHFGIQVRENCLVESVWLIGDSIPLVTETAYSKLCGDAPVYDRMDDPEMQQKLLVLIAKFLTELGTVEVRGNDFYPIRAKKAAPPAPEAPAGGGKAAEEFDEADQEARLRAQVQAMLDQQKKDDQK